MASLVDRMIRAARLEPGLYEEVEADAGATGQATAAVVVSSLAAGIGSTHEIGVLGLVFGTVFALIGWYVWAFITYFLGTRLLPQPSTQADLGQLLRALGFASAPGVVRIFGVIGALESLAWVVASLWTLCATVVAVRQALDYDSTGRAVLVCLIGWLVQLAIVLLPFLMLGAVMIGEGGVTRSA